MIAPTCPYCDTKATLIDAGEVYGPSRQGQFNVWKCSTGCDAYVSATSHGAFPSPTGTLADKHLRGLRSKLAKALEEHFAVRSVLSKEDRKAYIRNAAHFRTTFIQRSFPTSRGISYMTAEDCLAMLAVIAAPKLDFTDKSE